MSGAADAVIPVAVLPHATFALMGKIDPPVADALATVVATVKQNEVLTTDEPNAVLGVNAVSAILTGNPAVFMPNESHCKLRFSTVAVLAPELVA